MPKATKKKPIKRDSKPCDRKLVSGQATTGQVIDNVVCCPQCKWPFTKHPNKPKEEKS